MSLAIVDAPLLIACKTIHVGGDSRDSSFDNQATLVVMYSERTGPSILWVFPASVPAARRK